MKKTIMIFILLFYVILWYQILFGLIINEIWIIDNAISIINSNQQHFDFSNNFLFFKNLILSVYFSIYIPIGFIFSMIFALFMDFNIIKKKIKKQFLYNLTFIFTFIIIFLSTFCSIIMLIINNSGVFGKYLIWIYSFLFVFLIFSNYLFYLKTKVNN